MLRPRAYTIAIVLMVLYSLLNFAGELPNLMRGAVDAPNVEPFALVLVNFVTAVLGLVSAYGVWRMEKWGVMLMLVVAAIDILASLPAVLFAPEAPLRLMAGLGVVWCAVIIVLLLRPSSKSAPAS